VVVYNPRKTLGGKTIYGWRKLFGKRIGEARGFDREKLF